MEQTQGIPAKKWMKWMEEKKATTKRKAAKNERRNEREKKNIAERE